MEEELEPSVESSSVSPLCRLVAVLKSFTERNHQHGVVKDVQIRPFTIIVVSYVKVNRCTPLLEDFVYGRLAKELGTRTELVFFPGNMKFCASMADRVGVLRKNYVFGVFSR